MRRRTRQPTRCFSHYPGGLNDPLHQNCSLTKASTAPSSARKFFIFSFSRSLPFLWRRPHAMFWSERQRLLIRCGTVTFMLLYLGRLLLLLLTCICLDLSRTATVAMADDLEYELYVIRVSNLLFAACIALVSENQFSQSHPCRATILGAWHR